MPRRNKMTKSRICGSGSRTAKSFDEMLSKKRQPTKPMTLNTLPDECKGMIVNNLSIQGSIKFSQTSRDNVSAVKDTRVDQLGESFKNAIFANSCVIEAIKSYMLEGGSTLDGHKDVVRSPIQLKDGRIVSASFDNTLKVWDLTKPEGPPCVATLKGHTNVVSSVIQLKDDRLVSASWDNTLKVWDLTKPEGQQCVATLRGHDGEVNSVIQLKDGRLVSASYDKTLKVWGVPIN